LVAGSKLVYALSAIRRSLEAGGLPFADLVMSRHLRSLRSGVRWG